MVGSIVFLTPVAALVAVAAAVAVYYAVPQTWIKVLWGVGVGAVGYLVVEAIQSAMVSRSRPGAPTRAVGVAE